MKILLILMIVFLIPIVIALEECKPVTPIADLPCQVTSTWDYSPPCNSHNASIFTINGTFQLNYTYQNFTDGKCYFVFNLTEPGSYKHYTDNGDTGDITVEAKDEMAIFSIVFFLIILNIGIFISPRFFELDSEIANYSVKRGIFLLGLMFLGFNLFVLFVVASEYLTILANEMRFLFWLVETGLFITILTVMAFTLINRVKMIKEKKKMMDMGGHNE